MVTLKTFEGWLNAPAETEQLEFKEAKQQYDGRVLVFEIPPRPVGQPRAIEGAYLMRAGEDLVPMTPDLLKRIFVEDRQDWFPEPARSDASADDAIAPLGGCRFLDQFVRFKRQGFPIHPTISYGLDEEDR